MKPIPYPVVPRLALLAGMAAAVAPFVARANPAGLTVQGGTATLGGSAGHLTVTTSHQAVLNWQSFNVGAGERTTFLQPSAASVVLNRIGDAQPSQIFGRVEANGVLILENRAGFHFGPGASVSAAGLVVTTAPATPVEGGAGLFWQFQGAPPSVAIVNYGRLDVGAGGSAFLIADRIENHGEISAPGGSLGLAAGREVLLAERPDGRGLAAVVRLPEGSIDNTGRLVADAGTIVLQARVVNQDGLVQANSVRERHGVIELVAAEQAALGAGSVTTARGDIGRSDAGRIVIQSGGVYVDRPGARLSVAGGGTGGDGGFVGISAPRMAAIHAEVAGGAAAGAAGGRLLIDPLDIILGTSGGGTGSGSVGVGDPPADGTLTLDVNTAFTGFSEIRLQAARNLTVAAGTQWDLAASTGVTAPGSHLHLEAGNHLTVANGAAILAGENWSVTLEAGRNFAAGDGALTPGVGNLGLAGTGAVQARNGDLRLRAGNNVTVAAGHVRTVAGGDIAVEALAGSINTGTKNSGFVFLPSGYQVSADLGGVSTAAGGDVSLRAGLDVTGFLPSAGGNQTSAGSGAFGAQPGNVTVTAGRDVAGHFVVRRGAGVIQAGRDAGTPARLLALSVVAGGWTVTAARDVLLQEVRNPNGVFNNLGSTTSANRHRFDYAPDAYVFLTAGNAAQLRGTGLPRYNDAFSQGMPPIYPGRLEVAAGAGGVILGNDVIVFPSPLGGLRVTTTDGGPLVGTRAGDLAQLVLSDSGRTQYRAFGDFGLADRAATPVHLDRGDEPVRLDISGDLVGVLIGAPKRAEITVGGDMINGRFEGQNLRPEDVTFIHVAGDVRNRNEFTSTTSGRPPDFALFDPLLNLVFPPLAGAAAGVESRFFYNPATGIVTFQGRMSGEQLRALLNLQVRTFTPGGIPILQPNGEPVTRPAEFLPPAVLQELFALSQDVPLNPDTGYRLGGGGILDFRARGLDLGATVGLVSHGPRNNPALARLFTHGADVQVTLGGDLEMFSSRIATLNGGAITLVADGQVNVGSRDFTVSDAAARGIYTADLGDVTVLARGDVNVNGSRIAAYDGGRVTVRSLEGNVDAGTGGTGAATVEKIYVDPVTRQVLTYAPTIPGSGILATSFPRSQDPAFPASVRDVGDILVETPRGDIIASAGGVVQVPLNGLGATRGSVTLRAGSRDAEGNVVHEGGIDASGSGVIGSTVNLDATGDIRGLVFARENIDLRAQQNVNVTALAQGSVSVGAGGTVSGTIIGVGSVAASGATVDAALLSQNVATSGEAGSAQVGFAQGTAAAAAAQGLQATGNAVEEAATAPALAAADEEEARRARAGAAAPQIVRYVGRVTVILPPEAAP